MQRSVALVCAITIFFSLYILLPNTFRNTPAPVEKPTIARPKTFPRKVWQTWQGSKQLEDEPLRLARSWVELNPGYGYELLTDTTSVDYIRKSFAGDEDLLDTWTKIDDYILRADLIRYLAMLEDGGIYADMDTDCSKPIKNWLPSHLEEAAEVVVGIEFDERADPPPEDLAQAAQFCSWTMMAKPKSLHMQHVVDMTLSKLRLAIHEGSIRANNMSDVLELTGPRVCLIHPNYRANWANADHVGFHGCSLREYGR